MLIPIPKPLADLGLLINRAYYRQRLKRVYLSGKAPSWFDHRIDLYYHWPHHLFWIERGLFALRHMRPGSRVLDLFCGDGFFAGSFYANVASHVDGVDRDPKAIDHANRYSKKPNVRFHLGDVIKDPLGSGKYDVITWFEAIEHLSEADYKTVIDKVHSVLNPGGVLVGSTPLVKEEHKGHLHWEHEHEFSTEEELIEFLKRDFRQVRTEVTRHQETNGHERVTAYFSAKDPIRTT